MRTRLPFGSRRTLSFKVALFPGALGFTTAGLGNYITTAASVRGHSSAYFHSFVPDASRTTCATGQGAGQSYSRFEFDDSINAFDSQVIGAYRAWSKCDGPTRSRYEYDESGPNTPQCVLRRSDSARGDSESCSLPQVRLRAVWCGACGRSLSPASPCSACHCFHL